LIRALRIVLKLGINRKELDLNCDIPIEPKLSKGASRHPVEPISCYPKNKEKKEKKINFNEKRRLRIILKIGINIKELNLTTTCQ